MAGEGGTASSQGWRNTTYSYTFNFQAPHALTNAYGNATADQHNCPVSLQQGNTQLEGPMSNAGSYNLQQPQGAQRKVAGGLRAQPPHGQYGNQGTRHPACNPQSAAPQTAQHSRHHARPGSSRTIAIGTSSRTIKLPSSCPTRSSLSRTSRTPVTLTVASTSSLQPVSLHSQLAPRQHQQALVKLSAGVTGPFLTRTPPALPQQFSAEEINRLRRRLALHQIQAGERQYDSDGGKLRKRREASILRVNMSSQTLTTLRIGPWTIILGLPHSCAAVEIDFNGKILAYNTREAAQEGYVMRYLSLG